MLQIFSKRYADHSETMKKFLTGYIRSFSLFPFHEGHNHYDSYIQSASHRTLIIAKAQIESLHYKIRKIYKEELFMQFP